jgi:hypothetical protein
MNNGTPRLSALDRDAQRVEAQKAANGCLTLVFAFVLGALVVTLGWNYGASEVIEALGGKDGNINVVVGFFVFLLTRAVQK